MDLPLVYHDIPIEEKRLVRAEYIRLQDGKCCHCGASLDGDAAPEILEKEIDLSLFPEGFLKHPHHLHHSHETGLTIGVVHGYCNAVLWQYHGE